MQALAKNINSPGFAKHHLILKSPSWTKGNSSKKENVLNCRGILKEIDFGGNNFGAVTF